MPKETVIKRISIVTIESRNLNSYGDLVFTDSNGEEYKLSKKREKYFGAIQPGRTVKLSYAEWFAQDKNAMVEYIAEVGTAEPPKTPLQSPVVNKAASIPQKQYKATQPISGAENGMILKEIGDCFRTGRFTEGTQPELWEFYKGEISRVTGVTVR